MVMMGVYVPAEGARPPSGPGARAMQERACLQAPRKGERVSGTDGRGQMDRKRRRGITVTVLFRDDVHSSDNSPQERAVKAKSGILHRMSPVTRAPASRTGALVEPSPRVPLKAAGKQLGVHFYRPIGRGRSCTVYEVSDSHREVAGRLAGKLCVAGDAKAAAMRQQAEQESRLAEWAASRQLGPKVQALRTSVLEVAENEEPLHAALLLMEKATTCLHTLGLSGALADVQRAWQYTFELLATCDFSITADAVMGVKASGWLCCDDLKPENVLVYMLGQAVDKPSPSAASQRQVSPQVASVCLTDWDARHWHPVPVSKERGALLNRLLLIFNCVVRWHRLPCERAVGSLLHTLATWPDQERALARDLGTLAAAQSSCMLQFLVALDGVLMRGPYYYARVSGKGRRERARHFMDAYASALRSCLPLDADLTAAPEAGARLVRRQLAEITKTVRRCCLAQRCVQVGAPAQPPSASPKGAHED